MEFFGGEKKHKARNSSHGQTPLALFEKRAERGQVIFVRSEQDGVDPTPAERSIQLGTSCFCQGAEARPGGAIRGIDLDLFAGFRVFQRDNSDVGQHFFALILDVNGNEIMSPPADGKFARKIARLKIGNEKTTARRVTTLFR